MVFKPLNIRRYRRVILQYRTQTTWSEQLPSLSAFRDFPDYGAGSRGSGRARLTLWVEVMSLSLEKPWQIKFTGQRSGKKRDSERELQISAEGPLRYRGEYWWAHTCEDTAWEQGKSHMKGSKELVLSTYTRPKTEPVFSINCGAVGKAHKKILSSCWGYLDLD